MSSDDGVRVLFIPEDGRTPLFFRMPGGVWNGNAAFRELMGGVVTPGTDCIYGPVTIAGRGATDVPQRLIDYFGAQEYVG